MKSIRNFTHRYPLSTGLITVFIELLIFFIIRENSHRDLMSEIIVEFVYAAITMFFVYIVAGKLEVEFSSKSFCYTLKKCWWALATCIFISVVITIQLTSEYSSFIGNPFLILILTVVQCLFIGIFEESLIRGLLFNCLLSEEGGSHRGILTAMILSSLIFGIGHIIPNFINLFPNITLAIALEMVGRTLQTGMLGFLFAAIYVKTHNLWSVALIHGLIDFILIFPRNLYQTAAEQVSEITGDETLSYLILIVLFIPLIVTAVRIVKSTSLSQYGFFKEKWYPLEITNKKNNREIDMESK